MNPKRWRKVDELFHAAVDCAGPERERVLNEGCGDDSTLRAEVESLLTAHQHAANFIDTPAFDTAPGAFSWASSPCSDGQHAPSTLGTGERIGPYTLCRILGTGGMGVVWEAAQERPRRMVALKVIRPGLLAPMVFRRFEREAETLARLQHPGIAQIFEAGTHTTETGTVAYFAMELVKGEPITDYLRNVETSKKRRVEIGERLELFVKICEAVGHAHQRGVIHRDLKPNNILIAEVGAVSDGDLISGRRTSRINNVPSAHPKILDFGVALTMDSDVQMTTLHTDVGQIIGTLPYMSPEQVAGRPDQIDTRSDVYSLGVLLYQLLSGRLPYDLSANSFPEAARIICEQAIAPLRTKEFNSGHRRELLGRWRRHTAGHESNQDPHVIFTARLIRYDLETIVAKALEKDPNRRYATVSEFASDVERYLRNEPIAARPASAFYQLRKWVARNRVLAAVSAIFAIVVIGLAVSMSMLFVSERRASKNAETQAAVAEQRLATSNRIKTFLESVFLANDPDLARGEDPRASELLARGMKRVEDELDEDPIVRSEVMGTLGTVSVGLSRFDDAISLLKPACELRVKILGGPDPLTVEYQRKLADALINVDKTEDAIDLLREALAAAQRDDRFDRLTVAALEHDLGVALKGKDPVEAEMLHRQSLSTRRELLGEQHEDVADSLMGLGVVLRIQGRPQEAITCYETALPILLEKFGEDRVAVANGYINIAVAKKANSDFVGAEENYLKGIKIYRRLLGDEHMLLVNALHSLGKLYSDQFEYVRAEPYFREALDMAKRVFGEENSRVSFAKTSLGKVLAEKPKGLHEAEELQRSALATTRLLFPEQSAAVALAQFELSLTLRKAEKYQEALDLVLETAQFFHGSTGQEFCHPFDVALATTLRLMGRPEEAEALCRDAIQFFEGTEETPRAWILLEHELGLCLIAQERWDEAESVMREVLTRSREWQESPNESLASKNYWKRFQTLAETSLDTIARKGTP